MGAASFKSLYPKRPAKHHATANCCAAGAPDTALRHCEDRSVRIIVSSWQTIQELSRLSPLSTPEEKWATRRLARSPAAHRDRKGIRLRGSIVLQHRPGGDDTRLL